MDSQRFALAALLAVSTGACGAHAQGVASDRLVDSISVTAERDRAATETPSTIASKTAADLRLQNLVNPEDALVYVPNLTIRKRYIGDRNALIGGRSFSTQQSPRGLVLMDGYLLSNFLGRFDAPRWNMIAPEEIDRVDILYGPYSALYPGNSIGTTVAVRTRKPDKRTLSVRTTAFAEQFSEYGMRDEYDGYQVSAFIGGRLDNDAWVALAANRQDATSHPMQYYTVTANAAGEFPLTDGGEAIPVTGVVFDRDPRGLRRAVFGASGGAIDHTVQHQFKLRAGLPLAEQIEIDGFVGIWRNDTSNRNRTFLRDEAGREVWAGSVLAEGVTFDLPAAALAPSKRTEHHLAWGTTLRTTRPTGWNASLVYSRYDIRRDVALEASVPDPLAAAGGPGTRTERGGTGWRTLEAQGVYTPGADDWTGGDHTISIGLHRNEYQLRNPVYRNDDWRARNGVLTRNLAGQTRLQALYLQDKWQFDREWSLTAGLRYETWTAFDGIQQAQGVSIDYPERSAHAYSSKISLAFAPAPPWLLRLSAGRGVRFPTVAELFQGTATFTSIVVNDPNLKAEVADSVELMIEYAPPWGRLRTSVFEDDVRDSIFAQTNITVTPSITNVQNVERVRTRGIETAFELERMGWEALSLQGSIAYAHSRILENINFPPAVDKRWPRVPQWRGNLQAVVRANASWMGSLGLRYAGRSFNRLENDDLFPDTYGGVSRFVIFDARVARTWANGLEVAIGIDNLNGTRSYQSHPLPMRTAFVEARWSLEGDS